MIICESPLLFHGREGRGEHYHVMRYAPKQVAVNGAVFWQGKKGGVLHDHWGHLKKTPNQNNLWEVGIRYPFEAQPPQNQTYFEIILTQNVWG